MGWWRKDIWALCPFIWKEEENASCDHSCFLKRGDAYEGSFSSAGPLEVLELDLGKEAQEV